MSSVVTFMLGALKTNDLLNLHFDETIALT